MSVRSITRRNAVEMSQLTLKEGAIDHFGEKNITKAHTPTTISS